MVTVAHAINQLDHVSPPFAVLLVVVFILGVILLTSATHEGPGAHLAWLTHTGTWLHRTRVSAWVWFAYLVGAVFVVGAGILLLTVLMIGFFSWLGIH